MSGYKIVKVPRNGAKITMDKNNVLNVPDNPILLYPAHEGRGQ